MEKAYSDNDGNDETQNQVKSLFTSRAKKINGNKLYKIDKNKGTRKPNEEPKPEEDKSEKGHGGRIKGVPNKEKKPFELDFFKGGEYGNIYEYSLNNNVPVIRLNTDHKFYKYFISKHIDKETGGDMEVIDMVCTLLITWTTVQQQMANSEEVEKIFEAYNGRVSYLLSTEIEFDARDY